MRMRCIAAILIKIKIYRKAIELLMNDSATAVKAANMIDRVTLELLRMSDSRAMEIHYNGTHRKVTKTIPDTCFIGQKEIKIKSEIKNHVMLNVGNVHLFQRCTNSVFSSRLLQFGEEFLCYGNGSPDEIISICLEQEIREV
jgi:hypothetical protein